MMAAVFSMQGFGQLTAILVALVTTIASRNSFSTALTVADCIGECQLAADRSWRLIIGFGSLPAVFALYYRLTIPETPRFTFDVALDTEKACVDIRVYLQAEEAVAEILGESHRRRGNLSQLQSQLAPVDHLDLPHASWSDFYSYFTQYRNGSALFATMISWFLLDFAFYGLALNNAIILEAIGYSTGPNVYRVLLATCLGNLILVCAGSMPGYLLTVLTIDSLGRKPIQIGGFAILTLIFCVIGFGYNSLGRASLLALYILAQVFFNFGPNSTTFVVPGECFPTRYRSTCHGLSAACGKLGATVAQVMSQPLLLKGVAAGCKGSRCTPWLAHLMQIFAATMLCGTIVSFMIPETKRQTLEVLAGEEPQRGTQRSDSSRVTKNSFLAKLSSSLHGRGNKRGKSRKKGGSGNDNRTPVELDNCGSSASASSTGRIYRRPRSNEDGDALHIISQVNALPSQGTAP
jgi:PHS family inorganic phosphate transporter-like MFS transporter